MGSGDVRRLVLRWTPVLIGATLGILGGYHVGYAATLPGLAAIGAAVWLVILGLALGIAAGVGLVARAFARSRAIGVGILRATGAALATAIVVAVGVQLLGLGYREPVVLHASGTATLSLENVDSFVPLADAPVACATGPDVEEVREVFSPDLGEVPLGTVRAVVELPPGPLEGAGRVEVFIDGGDLPDGEAQPFWDGAAVFETNPDRTAGTARFLDAGLTSGAATVAGATPPLPPTLSGSIAWNCEGWRDPEATVRPESPGSLRLELPGEDVAAVGSQAATWKFEEDGTVLEVLSRGG